MRHHIKYGVGGMNDQMAELLMKSAAVELGAYAPRKLPYCWTPEQVRRILAAMPAGRP